MDPAQKQESALDCSTLQIPSRPLHELHAQLAQAISERDLPQVRTTLQQGADPVCRAGVVLLEALRTGFIEGARVMIESAKQRGLETTLQPVLDEALRHSLERIADTKEVARLLLESGADPALDFNAPLKTAMKHKLVDLVELLIQTGVDPRLNDLTVGWAAEHGSRYLTELLVEKLGTSKSARKILDKALIVAAEKGHYEIVDCLLSRGGDASIHNHEPLCRAISNDNPAVTARLLQADSDGVRTALGQLFNITEPISDSIYHIVVNHLSELCKEDALDRAARNGAVGLGRILLEKISGPTSYVDDTLKTALRKGHFEFAKMILERYSPDVTQHSTLGSEIIARGEHQLLERIIANGYSVDEPELCMAAARNDLKALEIVVKAGVAPREANLDPIILAGNGGKLDAIRFLTLLGAPCDNLPVGQFPQPVRKFLAGYLPLREDYLTVDAHASAIETSDRLMERAGLPNVSPEFRSALQSMGSVPWTYTLEIASAVAVASATVCNTPEHVETIFFILLRNQLQAMSEGHHNVTLTQGIEQLRDTVLSLGEIQETIARIAKELILPVWGHSLKDPQTLKQLSAPQCEQIQGAAYRFAAELAIADRPIKALRKINNAMHHPNSLLPADIRPYMDKEEWEPLFEDCVTLSNGFSIVALKSQAELVEEGERLSHCVGNGSYAASCSQGLSQILSLRRDKKAIATIELGVTQLEGLFSTQRSTSWEVCQFKGIENCKPDAQATAAFDEFVGLVAAGKVECTSGTRGSSFLPDSLLKTVSPFERMVGIPADELDVVDRILSHYESRARNFTFQLIPDRETLVRDISSAIRL